jgi:hypothetical protein
LASLCQLSAHTALHLRSGCKCGDALPAKFASGILSSALPGGLLRPGKPAQTSGPIANTQATVKLSRAQIRPGVKDVDVTVKSAKGYARVFSPTWSMVMDYKNGTLSEAQYIEQYMRILSAVSVEAWRWLYAQVAEGSEVTLLCYCRDE